MIFKIGVVPFGPTVLGYPPSDCSAVFTTRTPIHPYNTSFFSEFENVSPLPFESEKFGTTSRISVKFRHILGAPAPQGGDNPKIWGAL